MSLHLLGRLLLCCLVLSARAGYVLVAHFHTYENSLHAYINLTDASVRCCAHPTTGPPACTAPCSTTLDYCFKDFGTFNSVYNMGILSDCLGDPQTSQRLDHTDFIDFSSPPLTAAGTTTPTSITLRGDSWPGRIQFFVRSKAVLNLTDYLVDDLSNNIMLSPGETVANRMLSGGTILRSDVTFTASLSLSCEENFYGSDCTVHCRPADSDELGHYSCLSDGRIQCLEGYRNETSNCTECALAEGCPSTAESGSAVATAVGVSVGCLVVLIAIALVGVVVLMALQRRRKSHNVDFEDKVSDEKPHNIYSAVRTPGSNPVYDDEDLGGHLPLGRSATAAGGPEHQLDNPLYTMEAQTEVYYSSADQPPQHEYDYASTGSLPPATGPLAPPTSTAPHQYDYASLPPEEGELYDAPDVAPRPHPQQPQLTYDYAEPPAGTVGSPKAVYDAPLLAEEPATVSHDYDYASTAHSAPGDLPPEVSEHYDFGN